VGVGTRARRSWLSQLMPFAYPVILGTLETLVQMVQKAASSMALLTFEGESQACSPVFWGSWLLLVCLTLLVIMWLRKGLSALPSSRLLPVEYGTVTSTSILGGLILYQEGRFVPVYHLWMMGVGILLILIGCGLVGRRKTIKKYHDPGYIFNHAYLPRLKEGVAQMAGHTGLHAQHHRRTIGTPLTGTTTGTGARERSISALVERRPSTYAPPLPAAAGSSGALPSEIRLRVDADDELRASGDSPPPSHSTAQPSTQARSPARDTPAMVPDAAL